MSLVKNEGSDWYLSTVDLMKDFFAKLSTYDGRIGPPFTINIVSVDWATYLNKFQSQELPIFDIGWLADFADADNFIRPYMHSWGDFSYFQNYTSANGWNNTHGSNYPTVGKDELIDNAFTTPDGPDRAKMYADLEAIYVMDCPSVPIPSPTGRRWCQYWVKGWHYNAMYEATYIPSVYKYDDCWYDTGGTTAGEQDGIVNMRDISWLILHFNAKASIPGLAPDPERARYENSFPRIIDDLTRVYAFSLIQFKTLQLMAEQISELYTLDLEDLREILELTVRDEEIDNEILWKLKDIFSKKKEPDGLTPPMVKYQSPEKWVKF